MPDADPTSAKFMAAYAEQLALHEDAKPDPTVRHRKGTIGAAVRGYLASEDYLSLADSTRAYRRRFLEDIEKTYGRARIADLQPRHIKIDLSKLDPHPANNKLRAWRGLCKWADTMGLVETDPARTVRKRKTAASDGHRVWSRDDVAKFREYWPHNTPQRLTLELLMRSCAAIGDACRLGPGMIKDGWLSYRRQKTGTTAVCPITAQAPAWYEADHHFAECLKHAPRHMTFLVTAQGRSKSPKSAGQWFAAACSEAGLEEGLTAHGIRKFRDVVFKENGAPQEARMAIMGHENPSQESHYSKSADLKRIVESSNFAR